MRVLAGYAIGFAVVFGIAEAGFRTAGFDFGRLQKGGADPRGAYPVAFRQPDVPFGEVFFKRAGPASWTGRPLAELLPLYRAADSAYEDEPTITISFDRDGFRNAPDLADWDVVVAGDSFTEAGYLPQEQLFTSVLAEQTGLRVRNLGLCKTGPFTHIECLKSFGGASSCRHAVLAFFEGNDISDAADEAADLRKFHESGARPLRVIAPQTSLLRAVLGAGKAALRPKTTRRFQNAVFTAAGKSVPVTMQVPPLPENPHTMTAAQRALVARFLDAWRDAAMERGMKPWLLYIPINNRTYHGLVKIDDSAPREVREWSPTTLPEFMRAECAARGIAYIDTCVRLRAAAEQGTLVYNPILDTHLNAAGSRIVGEVMAEELARADRVSVDGAESEVENLPGIKDDVLQLIAFQAQRALESHNGDKASNRHETLGGIREGARGMISRRAWTTSRPLDAAARLAPAPRNRAHRCIAAPALCPTSAPCPRCD